MNEEKEEFVNTKTIIKVKEKDSVPQFNYDKPIQSDVKFEFNVGGENKFLNKKTYRNTNEFPVTNNKYNDYNNNFRDEDNKDLFMTDRHYNKLKYDILQLPDMVSSYKKEDLEANFFKYNYKENIRSFKPLVTNGGKNMSFTVQSDVFTDNNYFVLNLMITNPNKNNWLQYDQSPLKNITITNNSQLIEEIFDYNIIENIENDFNYISSFYNSEGTRNILIPPENLGTNTIFNPYQSSYDFMTCNQINNGKLSFKTQNSKLIQVRINSHVFGRHHTKRQKGFENLDENLTPMFLFTCLQINVELNNMAFFVPVFNARIQDLTNVSINDSEYEFSRLINEQNTEISKLISNLTFKKKHFVKRPRTNTTNVNVNFKLTCEKLYKPDTRRCLFSSISMYLFGTTSMQEELEQKSLEFMRSNQKISQDILAFSHIGGFNPYDDSLKPQDDLASSLKENRTLDNMRNTTQNYSKESDKMFKFTKKIILEAYIKRENKIIFGSNGMGDLSEFSSLVDLFALSTTYDFPIELYMGELNESVIVKQEDNNPVKENPKDTEVGLTLKRLEFVTLINGDIKKPVCRIALIEGFVYGLLTDIDQSITHEITKFIKNEDIFNEYSDESGFLNKMDIVEGGSSFLDLINEKFLHQILNNSYFEDTIRQANGLAATIYLYTIDRPKKMIKRFVQKKKEIIDIFLRGDFYRLSGILSLSEIYDDPFYQTGMLENVYYYSFLNFFYDAKTNKLLPFEDQKMFEDEDLVTSFYLSMFVFLQNGKRMVNNASRIINTLHDKIKTQEYITTEDSDKFNLITKINLKDFLNDYTAERVTDTSKEEFKKKSDTFKSTFYAHLTGTAVYLNYSQDLKAPPMYQSLIKKKTERDLISNAVIDIYNDKNKIMNSVFIENLLNSYGYDSTFKILSNLMPDLFNYKQHGEELKELLKKAENTIDFHFEELWNFLSTKFLSKFKTAKDLKLYNPFSAYDRKFLKYRQQETSIRKKMNELASQFKNVSFDVILYKEHHMLPVLGYLIKLQQYLNKYPQNLKDINYSNIVNSFILDQLKQSIILSINNSSKDDKKDIEETESKYKAIDTNSYMWTDTKRTMSYVLRGLARPVTTVVKEAVNAGVSLVKSDAAPEIALTGAAVGLSVNAGAQSMLGTAASYIGSLFYSSSAVAINPITSTAMTVYVPQTALLTALGPWGLCGLATVGAYGMYKVYSAFRSKNTNRKINEHDDGFDSQRMQTEMMMEVANASKLYFVQKDYDLTFKNTKNPAAAIDVISFAQKIKKGVKKYVNDDKKKFVVNIFDELYKELDDYTLDKIITNKDELVASKESLRVINESQQLSGVNEEIGNLKKNNANLNSICAKYGLYSFEDRKKIIATLSEDEYASSIGGFATFYNAFKKAVNLLGAMNGKTVLKDELIKTGKIYDVKWDDNTIKNLIEYLIKFWLLEEALESLKKRMLDLFEATKTLEGLAATELVKIQKTNELLKSYKLEDKIYKLNLNSQDQNAYKETGDLIKKNLENEIDTKTLIYKKLDKMSDIIIKKGIRDLTTLDIERYMKNVEKILIWHFKFMYPMFEEKYISNNFIFSLQDFNVSPVENENVVYTSNNIFYEMISDPEKMTEMKLEKKKQNKNKAKLNEERPTRDMLNSERENIHVPMEKNSIYFRKYSQKTELTPREIQNIKNFFIEEIQYKNIPYLRLHADEYLNIISTLVLEVRKNKENNDLVTRFKVYFNSFFETKYGDLQDMLMMIISIRPALLKANHELNNEQRFNNNVDSGLYISTENQYLNLTIKQKGKMEAGCIELMQLFFSKLYVYILDSKNFDSLKTKEFMNLKLLIQTLSSIKITEELKTNIFSILMSQEVPLIGALQTGSIEEINYLKDITSMWNNVISQIDSNILATAIVEELGVGVNKDVFDFYQDTKLNDFISVEDVVPDKVDTLLLESLMAEVMFNFQPDDSPKFYNKNKLPESNEVYKITHFIQDDDFIANFYILEPVTIRPYTRSTEIFEPILTPTLEGGISADNQTNNFLSSAQKIENVKLCFDYFTSVKKRMNDIFTYFSQEFENKTIYSTMIMEMMRKIVVRLSQKDDALSSLVLLQLAEIFFNISLSIIDYGVVSKSDLAKLEELPLKIEAFIQTYNEKNSDTVKGVKSMLEDLDDPELYTNLLNDIQKQFPKRIEPQYNNQKDFEINNNEINLSSQIRLSRHYMVEAEFLIKEVTFDGYEQLRQQIMQNAEDYSVLGSKLKIHSRYTFKDKVPPELLLSFYTPFKNLYLIILYKNEDYPTFRCSTRFNRGLNILGCEINGVRFPPYLMSGKSDNSNLNDQFLENLGYSLDIKRTSINKFNFAIDNSSTYYISKKIYGKNASLFEFEEKNNTYFDFRFGYQNEILGKAVFSISYDQIYFLMNNKIPIDQMNIKLIMENNQSEEIDIQDNFELLILEDTDYAYKYSKF